MVKLKKKHTTTIQKQVYKSRQELLFNKFIPFLVIIVIGGILYYRSVDFAFTGFDDHGIIESKMDFLSSIKNIPEAFHRDAFISKGGEFFYRPIQTVSFILDTQLSGKEPWGYHLQNIILHILTACGLFILLRRLSSSTKFALGSAIIFIVHPLFTHTVCWIPSRGDLILCLTGIFSFFTFIRYRESGILFLLVLHLILFSSAIFSKETAIFFPLIYLVYNYTSKEKRLSIKQLVILLSSWGTCLVLYLYLRSTALKPTMGNEFFILNFITNLQTIPIILAKMVLPINLSPMPVFEKMFTVIGILLILYLFLQYIKMDKNDRKMFFFGVFWYMIFMLPPLIFRNPRSIHAYEYLEHRAYLPVIGIFLSLQPFLKSIQYKIPVKYRIPSIIVVSVILAVTTFIHEDVYSGPLVFNSTILSSNPDNVMALDGLGVIQMKNGDLEGALLYFNKALILEPDLIETLSNRAMVKTLKKDYNDAIMDLNVALSIKKTTDYYLNRGLVWESIGDYTKSFSDFENAILLDSTNRSAYIEIGRIGKNSGDYSKALTAYNSLLSFVPTDFEAYSERSEIYNHMRDFKNALASAESAIHYNPNYFMAYINRGIAYNNLHDANKALEDFNIVTSLNPGYADAYYFRGMIQLGMKQIDKARAEWKQAANLGSNAAQVMLMRYP